MNLPWNGISNDQRFDHEGISILDLLKVAHAIKKCKALKSVMSTISILQSNYIPWKGYFDIIAKSDVFVVYDEVQFTKNDWRNRNLIKTNSGLQWLTIPVRHHSLNQKIFDTFVSSDNWAKKHIKTLQNNYAKANYFEKYKGVIFNMYEQVSDNLNEINVRFIKGICQLLEIETRIIDSRSLNLIGDRQERLIQACRECGANTYLSGPAAKQYLDEDQFRTNGIQLEWMDYSNYEEYDQLFPPFEHGVSILDLIFNEGPKARQFLKL